MGANTYWYVSVWVPPKMILKLSSTLRDTRLVNSSDGNVALGFTFGSSFETCSPRVSMVLHARDLLLCSGKALSGDLLDHCLHECKVSHQPGQPSNHSPFVLGRFLSWKGGIFNFLLTYLLYAEKAVQCSSLGKG